MIGQSEPFQINRNMNCEEKMEYLSDLPIKRGFSPESVSK